MIAILGASGYVGSKFVEVLSSRGLNFCGLFRKEVDYADASILLDWMRVDRARFFVFKVSHFPMRLCIYFFL
jgi:nucleoside-diphosphate-sugar epimerase